MRQFTQQQSVSTLGHICWEATFHRIIQKTEIITVSSLKIAVGTASSDGQQLGKKLIYIRGPPHQKLQTWEEKWCSEKEV